MWPTPWLLTLYFVGLPVWTYKYAVWQFDLSKQWLYTIKIIRLLIDGCGASEIDYFLYDRSHVINCLIFSNMLPYPHVCWVRSKWQFQYLLFNNTVYTDLWTKLMVLMKMVIKHFFVTNHSFFIQLLCIISAFSSTTEWCLYVVCTVPCIVIIITLFCFIGTVKLYQIEDLTVPCIVIIIVVL